MPDFYEQERRDRARRVLGLTDILHTIGDRLKQASALPGGPAMDMADDALNRLVAVLGMCSPLAHRRQHNGMQAFMWIEPQASGDPTFRWIVCNPNGSCQSGQESSQRLCEDVVGRLLSS